MRRLFVLYAREPAQGRVKSRLAAVMGAERAAELYRAFLADLGGALRRDEEWTSRAACAEGLPAPGLSALLPGWPLVAQASGDLGERLAETVGSGASEGFDAIAVGGSDAPLLSREHVHLAFAAVEKGAGAAFAPSPDGGFSLVALAAGVDAGALFRGVRWSTGSALSDCRQRADRLGVPVAILEEVPDVDVAADIPLLRGRLGSLPNAAPETARILREWGSG